MTGLVVPGGGLGLRDGLGRVGGGVAAGLSGGGLGGFAGGLVWAGSRERLYSPKR